MAKYIWHSEHHSGVKLQKWPATKKYAYMFPEDGNTAVETTVTDLVLENGRKYSFEVVAVNGAQGSLKHESHGVTVDTTPPVMSQVYIYIQILRNLFARVNVVLIGLGLHWTIWGWGGVERRRRSYSRRPTRNHGFLAGLWLWKWNRQVPNRSRHRRRYRNHPLHYLKYNVHPFVINLVVSLKY